jgi:thymidylate synthase (FAD)
MITNPKVELISWNEDSAKMAELAARVSHGTLDEAIGEPVDDQLIGRVLDMGHMNILEHSSFTFLVECSRVVSHQMVRHRFLSFTQESLRYVDKDLEDFEICLPEIGQDYNVGDGEGHKYYHVQGYIHNTIDEHLELMITADYSKLKNEDLRYTFPLATKTRFILTANARALFNFFDLRICNRAQAETREVALKLYRECLIACPEIFKWWLPRCWGKHCPQLKKCRTMNLNGADGTLKVEQLRRFGIVKPPFDVKPFEDKPISYMEYHEEYREL